MPASDDTLLMVRIEAQISKFERAMAKASGTATSTARKIETDFRRMDRNLASIGGGFVRGLIAPLAALASGREIGQAADAFTRIQNALRIVGLEGEAAAAVFDRLFASAQKNAAPVEALVNVYRAGALAQKELRVTSEELIRFTEGIAAALRVSGRSAEESRGALLQLSQAIGSGIVRAEEFNAILEGALPIAQAAARGLEEAGGSVAKLRTLIIDGKVSSEAFFRAFEAGQGTLEALAATADITLGGAFTKLQNSLIASIGRFNETFGVSQAVGEEFDLLGRQIDSLIGVFLSLAQPVEDIDARFRSIINSINGVAEAIGQFTGLGNVGTALGITSEEELRIQRASETAAAMRTDLELAARLRTKARQESDLIAGPAVPQKTVSLKNFAAPTATGQVGRSARSASTSETEREKKAVADLIAELEREQALIGATDTERRISNELRRAGAAATSTQKEQIAALITQIEAEEAAERQLIDTLDAIRDASLGALSAFNQSIANGEGAVAGLKAALGDLLKTIIQISEQQAITALFGAGGTTGAGSIFGKLFGGSFAGGGTLGAGKWGIAGERGPEMIRGPASISPMGGAQQQTHRFIVETIPNPLFSTVIRQEVDAGGRRTLAQVSGHLAEQQRAY